jgi:nucleoside-diphosphate-sugar epimerase
MMSGSDLSQLSGLRILITGASGWLGRETICLLNRNMSNLGSSHLTLAGSSPSTLRVHDSDYDIKPLRKISESESFDVIIHLAFATQDKANLLGIEEYERQNRALTSTVSAISARNPDAYKLILSSGAASKYQGVKHSGSPMGVYGNLKRELESNFSDSHSLVLRLWNTSGHHMDLESNYALSTFIRSARLNEPIRVEKNLKRSFVSASSILDASISYLLAGGYGIVNSGGETTTLMNLAETVAQVLDSRSDLSLLDPSEHPDLDYISPKTEIPLKFWRGDISLEEQIINTALDNK